MGVFTLQDDEMTMQYFRFGTPGGKPFVIIPGLSFKSVMGMTPLVEVQYRSLAGDHDLYLIDRRSNIPGSYSIYDMADDTAKALDMLGLKDPVIYGVSQGGMIAQAIAVKRPDLVGKLIVCSTAAFIGGKASALFESWARLADEKAVSELMMSFAEHVYSEEYCEKNRDAFLEFGKAVTDEELRGFAIMARSFGGFDVRGGLGSIKAPVLVMGAGRDKIFEPECAREIAELTQGEICIYDDEPHCVYDSNADVLLRIKRFADKQTAS